MTISDCILLASAIIVVAGWFVTAHLSRKHEISIRRTDYRIDTLKQFILFFIEANKTKSLDGFNDIQALFYLYGYDDEIELVQKIANLVTDDPQNPEWLKLLHDLNILCRNKLREELELPSVSST